jgi:putative membrane protein
MILGMAIGIALLVVLVWAAIRWFEKKTGLPDPRDTGFPTSGPTAMEILRQRYARNEIDAATFEQMYERLEAASSRET